jgi:hypothetical protein
MNTRSPHTAVGRPRSRPRWTILGLVVSVVVLLIGAPVAANAHYGHSHDKAPVALRFVAGGQPAAAEKNGPITSVAFDPAGPPIAVEVVDAHGKRVTSATPKISIAIKENPSGGTLSGTVMRKAVGGVATFNDLEIDLSGIDYTLQATSGPLKRATSEPFTVYDDTCAADEQCAAAAGDLAADGLRANVTGTGGPGTGGLLAIAGGEAPECAGDHNRLPDTVTTVGTNLENKIIEFRVSKAADQAQPNNGVAHYQVCAEPLDQESEFVDRDGNHVAVGQAGLLAACKPDSSAAPPCVTSKTKSAGAIPVITVRFGSAFKFG